MATAYRITATLLNSWNYMWEAHENWQEKAKQDFENYLRRIRTPPTWQMQRGIDYEELVVNGGVPEVSQKVAGGAFQVYAEKVIEVDGIKYKILGYLDALKEGIIHDFKRTTKYEFPKYINSYQHWVYFTLIPEAYQFNYEVASGYTELPYDTSVRLHEEVYHNDGFAEARIVEAIRQLVSWLKINNLYEIYKQNYKEEV